MEEGDEHFSFVVAGLDPAISLRKALKSIIGIAGTTPAMTERLRQNHPGFPPRQAIGRCRFRPLFMAP
jgi:hypothetical protein